jgi:hypothetical protein
MGLRWTAAGMLEAEKQFRKVIGYTQLPQLAVAIERQLHLSQPHPRHQPGGRDRSHYVTITPGTAVTERPRRPGQPQSFRRRRLRLPLGHGFAEFATRG